MYKNEVNLKYYLKILIYKSLGDYLVFRKCIFNIYMRQYINIFVGNIISKADSIDQNEYQKLVYEIFLKI